MAMDEQLGKTIKRLRLEQQLTLKELGDKSSLSASCLSLIERGRTSVNLTSLQNIAVALGKDITYFFEQPPQKKANVTRSYNQPLVCVPNSNKIYHSLAGYIPGHAAQLEPLITVLTPGQHDEDEYYFSHPGEEFGYILEGTVTLVLDGETYELYPGDSYHFLSTTPHSVANNTTQIARYLGVLTPRLLDK